MKKNLISLIFILPLFGTFALSASDNGGGNVPSNGKERPIRIFVPNRPGKKHIPSMGIDISIVISGCAITFDIPLEDYPLQVEVELLSEPFGYWSATFSDSFDTEMEFGGESGDYKLTITTSEDTTYIGYFNLD